MKKMFIIVAALQLASTCHGMNQHQDIVPKEMPAQAYTFFANLLFNNLESLSVDEQRKKESYLKERNKNAQAIVQGDNSHFKSEFQAITQPVMMDNGHYQGVIYPDTSSIEGIYIVTNVHTIEALFRWNTRCFSTTEMIYPWEKFLIPSMQKVTQEELLQIYAKYDVEKTLFMASAGLSSAALKLLKDN